MGRIVILCTMIFLMIGCARVRVEAPKEPIKLDISMRLDIYQHVKNDVNEIEDLVTGGQAKPKDNPGQSFLSFSSLAYAQGAISQEAAAAALRRKERRSELLVWERKGVLGENRLGLVEVRAQGQDLKDLVAQENSDRMVIYREIAQKNNASLEETQMIYAQRLHQDAPSGTPIETSTGNWQIK